MQVAPSPDLRDRISFYSSKTLTEQMTRGDEYKLKKVVTLLITDFVLITENDVYHNIYHLHDPRTGSTFTELIEINTLEIPKLREQDVSPLTDWMKFLSTNKKEELDMLASRNKAIEKATTVLYELSQDEKTRMLYDAREKAKWDEESRLRGAEEKGIEKGLLEAAVNGLKGGISMEVIMKMTGLDLEVIEGLKKDLIIS